MPEPRGMTALLREELAMNHEGPEDDGLMRHTCDECVEAVRAPFVEAYRELADAAKYLPLSPEQMPGGPVVGEIVVERFTKALHNLHVLVST